jgi:serine/threonine-protein kinase
LEKAASFDPRNDSVLGNLWYNYFAVHRFPEAIAILERKSKAAPHNNTARVFRDFIYLQWQADPKPLHETIADIVTHDPASATDFADDWLYLALCERDPVAADRALAAMKSDVVMVGAARFPRAWFEGLAARTRGDETSAQKAFGNARLEAERMVREEPDYAPQIATLGLIDAALGRKDNAIREGRRALELLPPTKDAMRGAYMMQSLAIIYAWSGEKDLAIDQVAATLQFPGSFAYGYLRLHPFWDPLRGDPRFEKIVASLAPKKGLP